MRARSVWVIAALCVGCSGGGDQDDVAAAVLVVPALDTLVTTESGLIGYPVDVDVLGSGVAVVVDYLSAHLVLADPTGDVRTIGRAGVGPGELDDPWAVRAVGEELLVVDRGNGRIQRLTTDGGHVDSSSTTPVVLSGFPFLLADGGMLIGSRGRDECLAYVLDASGEEVRRVGEPVVDAPPMMDFGRIKEAIGRGEVPAELRNEALVAGDSSGVVWLALQTEAEVRRYDASGALQWSIPVDEPEMPAIKEAFFRRNAEDERPNAFASLRYFVDVGIYGGDLWVLVATQAPEAAVILVYGADGARVRRIEIPGAGGASQFAVDEGASRLYLATPDDAQLVMADLGAGVSRGP